MILSFRIHYPALLFTEYMWDSNIFERVIHCYPAFLCMKRGIMKLYKTICISILFILCVFSAAAGAEASDRLQIVATIFPEYDWVRTILGKNPADAELTLLLDDGVDLHSYQPTVEDMLKITNCDLFIYVGGESDEWVEDALRNAANKNMVVLNLLDMLGDAVKEEEVVEGMQEEDHDHHHDEDDHDEEDEHHDDEDDHDEEHHHDEDEAEYDEHVWLSLRNASVLCGGIADALCSLDPENADYYRKNTAEYQEKLAKLDDAYQKAVSEASLHTVLFGDRFPFRYLTDDYGLDYYAAFVGCSAETEASFETIIFLTKKVDELSLHTVLTIEGRDHRIAKTIVENTASKDQQILTMDSMQGETAQDIAAGVTYISVMQLNLEVLRDALK